MCVLTQPVRQAPEALAPGQGTEDGQELWAFLEL